jgi:hypothetical protein
LPVVGIENAALDGTETYWLEPLKSAAWSALGSAAVPVVPLWYVPVWLLPVRSGSVPVSLFIAQ